MQLKTHRAVILLSVFSLFTFGCGKDKKAASQTAAKPSDPPANHVVAMVNSTPLTWGDMNKRAMGYLKDDVDVNHLIIPSNRLDEAKEYFRRRAINAFIFKTVMTEEAIKQKIRLTDSDYQAGLTSLATTLKSRNWTTNDFFAKGPLDEASMRREFEDGLVIDKLFRHNVGSLIRVEQKDIIQAIEMIGATNDLKRARLETVRKQLLDGANFEDVARTVSECPSAQKGGDLGEFPRGKMLKPFDDAAFSQKVGAIGPIVETLQGFHIIKVTAHTPARAATASTPAIPETVRASQILIRRLPVDRKRIADALKQAKFNAEVKKYYTELKSHAKIECYLYKDMKF